MYSWGRLLFFSCLVQANRIWIIRHCDKPSDPNNPCCSERGYERANAWADFFLSRVKNPVFFASNYHENKTCGIRAHHYNRVCQKSQRMYLTAEAIQSVFPGAPIYTDFCVGEKRRLVDNIRHVNATDTVLVWEHHEIVEIVRILGHPLRKWRNRWIDEYSLVFMLDIKTNQFDYACMDQICRQEIRDWLDPVLPRFETVKKPDIPWNVYGYFAFVAILFLTFCVAVSGPSRQGYTEIL